MRTLRWAAEKAISSEVPEARLGLLQLQALGDSDMLDSSQQLFIDAAIDAIVQEPVKALRELGEDTGVFDETTNETDNVEEGN